jgi:hypothetical protein
MTRRKQAVMRFLLPVAAFLALCATGQAQTSGDPHNWDIAGIRLGISVDQARAALHAHDPSMNVQVLQSPSQVGKGTFTIGVMGTTGSPPGKGEGIIIAFTETEGNKAYSITRVLNTDQSYPAVKDVLTKQLIEKYGEPSSDSSALWWTFGANGRHVEWNVCDLEEGQPFQVGGFDYFAAAAGPVNNVCGVGLKVQIMGGPLSTNIHEALIDGQLQYRDFTNISQIQKDAEAKRLKEKAAEAKQKSPF